MQLHFWERNQILRNLVAGGLQCTERAYDSISIPVSSSHLAAPESSVSWNFPKRALNSRILKYDSQIWSELQEKTMAQPGTMNDTDSGRPLTAVRYTQ